MPSAAGTVLLAAAFTSSIGINTHFHNNKYGYENHDVTVRALAYLNIHNLRDSAESAADVQTWTEIARAANAKFDDYMPEGSPDEDKHALTIVPQLAAAGLINYVEGGNEEDDPYAIQQGNSIAFAAGFQQQVYQVAHSAGIPVINMSFGQGWTAANNWRGNYDKVGDLSSYADYANAHTYPKFVPGDPHKSVMRLNANAKIAATQRPFIVTELGWKSGGGNEQVVAKALLNGLMDAALDGATKTYIYALYDDASGSFGIMNSDGTPKPAGQALHTLMGLLADSGTASPQPLSYHLDGAVSGDQTLVLRKSDGSAWLAIWNEADSPHTVTVNLPAAAQTIDVFDPLVGAAAASSARQTTSTTVNVGDHVMLVRIVGG